MTIRTEHFRDGYSVRFEDWGSVDGSYDHARQRSTEPGIVRTIVERSGLITDRVVYENGEEVDVEQRQPVLEVLEHPDTLLELLRDFETARVAFENREDDQYLPELEGDLEEAALEIAYFIADHTRPNY